MQVVLTNTSPLLVPLFVVRYLVGAPLRALGHLLVGRRPARAIAELRALGALVAHPRVVTTGRRDRSGLREVPQHELRHLFPSRASRWRSSPWRIARAASAQPVRPRSTAGTETGPVAEETESLSVGDGVLAGFLRRPGSLLFMAMSLLALIAERHVLSGTIHGGELLPATTGASGLWSTYVASFHPSSVGSFTPAPPSLAVLALLSSILFGKAWLVVDLLILGAVPFAALSAYTAAGALTRTERVRVWVAAVYALLPAVTGAVAGGRLDVAVVAIVLPQLLRGCAAAVRRGLREGGWRLSVGAGLLLAVAASFAPVLWIVAVPVFIVGIGFLELESEETGATVGRLAAAAVVLATPLVVLLPWSWHLLAHPRLVFTGQGLPELYGGTHAASGASLLLLHAGGAAQPPLWVGVPILAAALLGLTRQSRVAAARTGVWLLVVGVALAVALTRGAGVTPGFPTSRHWPGLALLVAGAGALLAALVAAVGARPALREHSFGWRQTTVVGLVGLALAATATLAVGWLVRGADRPLTSGDPAVLPLFTQSELDVPTAPRALVLRSVGGVVSYSLVRRPTGPRLGDAAVAPRSASSPAALRLAGAVRDLLAGRPGAGDELQPFAVGYVVAPTATASRIAPALGKAATLRVVPAPGATVWHSALPTGELTLLTTPAAAARATSGLPVGATGARALHARPGSADVTIPAGPTGRLLVLAEPASSRWHAEVDGQTLASRTAYGWAQAFAVPGAGGRLTLGTTDAARTAWLALQLVCVLGAVVAVLPGRRPDAEDEAP